MKDRYSLKFVNGYHVIFDNLNYENVQLVYLKSEGERILQRFNKGGK